MKEYKLISLDEYDSYLKWKNGNINKTTESEDQNIDKNIDEFKDEESINSEKEITPNISSKIIDTAIMDTAIKNSSEPLKANSSSMELLPPPGIPLNNDNTKNISYKQNGEQSEWIQYWRKSIR